MSGEPLADVLDELGDAFAVGVNCVAAPVAEAHVALIADRLPAGPQIIAYANHGYADDAGNWIATDAVEPHRYAEYARRWVKAGARIVGGCCGTTPATIRAVSEVLSGDGTAARHIGE